MWNFLQRFWLPTELVEFGKFVHLCGFSFGENVEMFKCFCRLFFFFPFSAQNKTKPKESRVLLLPLLPVGSDFLRHRCHQEKDDFLITQAFFALSSFILYQKQTALAGECIGLVCWAQCLTAERPLVWQVFLLTEAFPAVKILVIPFPSVKQ